MRGKKGVKFIGFLGVLAMSLGLLSACSSGVSQASYDASKAQLATIQQQLTAAQQQVTAKDQSITKLNADLKAAMGSALRNDKEVSDLKTVRPSLVDTLAALQAGDVAKARNRFDNFNPDDYNTIWHGMEVYVNFRSPAIYHDLEAVHQAQLTKLMNDPQAKVSDMVVEAQTMLAEWDAIMALDQAGPALSPLFNDLANIRLVKAQTLTIITAKLKAGDVATSKALYTQFANKWADIEDSIHERSASAYSAIEDDMSKVNTAFQKPTPDVKDLTPLVATLLTSFNFGQGVVNAAARNSDLTKTTYASGDVQAAAVLAAMQSKLDASLASWKAGNYADAGAAAQLVNGTWLSNVTAALKAHNNADAALKTALDAYAALAGKAGDAGTVGNAELAAVRAAAVAQQVMVGQFWTDSKLQDAIRTAAVTIK